MKQKMLEKDGVRTEVADNGSVEAMVEAGWKVVGDAPDQQLAPEVAAGMPSGKLLPAMFRTQAFLEAALNTLPAEIPNADEVIVTMREQFGDLFTEDMVKFIRERELKEDNTGVDPQYTAMTKVQLQELLDAKGLEYKPSDNKARLAEILKASNPANKT